MNENIFELTDVSYSYLGKFPALCGINVHIPRGKKIVLLGANGTGKSTLLQVLDGLIFPDRGRVVIDAEDLTEAKLNDEAFSRSFRKKVGFVFQNPEVQLFCPTVREDIAFGPLQLGVKDEEVISRMEAVAQRLEISHLLDRSCHQLSIGEKRKVAIATTLVIQSEVLLLDEPTAGLDPATSRHIIEIIEEAASAGKTVVAATHDLHLVEEIADIIFVFGKDKRIIRSSPCGELLNDHEFLCANNLVHAHRHRHQGVVHTHTHQHLEHQHDHGQGQGEKT
jgi:cobalt/nickel transport system ATP-binding protein